MVGMRKAVRAIVIKDDALLVMHRNKFGDEYYTLIGGGVEADETVEDALHREVMEETTLSIAHPRLVFIEDGGEPYGDQHIFLADYESGEVGLHDQSEEALSNQGGLNTYTPMWLPLSELPTVTFLSETLKQQILDCLQHGWPETVVRFKHQQS